ncbi:hypothetical protein V1511DRAFT_501218 [Dipodascopsis uninucleata]
MSALWKKITSYREVNANVSQKDPDNTPPPFPALNSAQRASERRVCSDPSEEDDQEDGPYGDSAAMPPPLSPARTQTVPRINVDPASSNSCETSLQGLSTPTSNVTRLRGGPAVPTSVRSLPKYTVSHMAPPQASAQMTLAAARRQRQKVALEPGYSQLDWANLKKSGKNLNGLSPGQAPNIRVSLEELKMHSSPEDAWTALGGKVYNITPYLRYHPGGQAELMRCAGRDGTDLFNLTHMWVNYDRMLSNCLIGYLMSTGHGDF